MKYHLRGRRVYTYACPHCGAWSGCATRLIFEACQHAGMCIRCQADPQWPQHVYIRLLELHIEDITRRGRSLPENQRAVYRILLQKRRRQLAAAKAHLEVLV